MRDGLGVVLRQRGAALAISLIILLVLTVLGVAGMHTTTMEERMAGNARDQHVAFEAAEAALLGAQAYLENNISDTDAFDSKGADGLYNNAMANIWKQIAWTDKDSLAYAGDMATTSAPRFVIEHYSTTAGDADQLNLDNYGRSSGDRTTALFRITARGTGGSDNTAVVLQSTYGKQIDP